MNVVCRILLAGSFTALLAAEPAVGADHLDVALPDGVQAVWDLQSAQRETTATREQICINGLWQWQPADATGDRPPARNWGFFKVPGCWPGITDYMQKDSQTLFVHPAWKNMRQADIKGAWYQRQIEIPKQWAGRRVALTIECLNSHAAVFVDGKPVGELSFPGGEMELTDFCRPGESHLLSLRVTALLLKAVMLAYNDTNQAREVPGTVARRGLCGDLFLVSTPKGPRVADVRVNSSVRKREITFDAALDGLSDESQYVLSAKILSDDREVAVFKSTPFERGDLREGRFAFARPWTTDQLWDLHTPQNTFQAVLSLESADNRTLDVGFNTRFGYREFWIDGKDFFLNGSRVFLSAVPLDNAQVSAASATYEAARESLERLKSFGINFVYTHNYGCEPGDHLSFAEILRAADDVGMLVALSLPHFAQYDWLSPDADQKNGYARHAEPYVRIAQNHPSVVAYAMSHNATGYGEDMNPDMIDGLQDRRSPGERNYAGRALRAEAVVRRFDPTRVVYHHSSGNLGSMHTVNFYPNFVPKQELSDWFEHWATVGVKPVFLCEYGAPFAWDWAMYRGWYQGERSFGSARVPWDFCLTEWNAQFFGDRAFPSSEYEKANLRWEARQFAAGKLWHRWDYPQSLNSKQFTEREPIWADYITDNWRAFRTWGVSAISPWEHEQFWKLKEGVDRGRKDLPVDWQALQRPGFSPDYLDQRYERMDLAYERSDRVPTAAAEALLRSNMPVLAYIAGKPDAFTSKDHNFVSGETVEKQIIVINNSRKPISGDCAWSIDLPTPVRGTQGVVVPTGDQTRIAIQVPLAGNTPAGEYELRMSFRSSSGDTQNDTFTLHVLPRPATDPTDGAIALYDPHGETSDLLDRLGIDYQSVDADSDLSAYQTLVVGKAALTVDGPAPDIARVADGLRVLVFEQTAEVLAERFGFRVAEYGLRWVFTRLPDHPALAGLVTDHLRDWRGAATLEPPRLKYELRPRYGPTVQWCGMPVTHIWRCGNRGNVASVLMEKPARGDFLPILDGGYSLQYSPLIEHREGQGMMLFCQLDVTGRAETDPAADTLAQNLLNYVSAWKPAPRRSAIYVGEQAGREHLESVGIAPLAYHQRELSRERVLIVGRGGGNSLAPDASAIAEWLKAGGNLLAIGLDDQEAQMFLRVKIGTKAVEHISTYFDAPGVRSPIAGIGPADVQNRDPTELPLLVSGARVFGDGVLGVLNDGNVLFCQMAAWQFGGSPQLNLRKTFRRSSYLLTRLLANLGLAAGSPIVGRFHEPVDRAAASHRWQQGLYLDQPEEWDDPYRFFRW